MPCESDPVDDLICPQPKILVGIRVSENHAEWGTMPVVIPRIWGICADPALNPERARFEWQTTNEIGPVAGSYASATDWIVADQVANPNVLVGLHGSSGDWVDRVGTLSGVYGMTYCTGVGTGGPDPLNRVNWSASASASSSNPDDAIGNAFDASPTTRWSSGKPQSGDEWFKLDLGGVACLGRVSITAPNDDFPSRFAVFASIDDHTYVPVGDGAGEAALTVDFPSRDVRYLRIDQTGMGTSWWSIGDISVDK